MNTCSFRGIILVQSQRFALAMLQASQGTTPVLEVLMQDYSTLPLFSLQPETKEIPLTQGKVAIVDAADYDWLMQWKWSASVPRGGIAYARRSFGPRSNTHNLLMHRAILNAPHGVMVDHVNGDGLDNRRSNLRLATCQQNHYNTSKRCNNTSGYKGVYWRKDKKKWQVQMRVDGINRHIGYFGNIEDAARAYDAAAKDFHGEFARFNLEAQ